MSDLKGSGNDGKERKNSGDGKDRKKDTGSASIKDRKKDNERKEKKKDEKERKDKKPPNSARSSIGSSSSSGASKKPKGKEKGGSDIMSPGTPQPSSRGKEGEHSKRDSNPTPAPGSGSPSFVDRRTSLPSNSHGGPSERDLRRPSLAPSHRFSTGNAGGKTETPSDFIFQSLMGEFKEQAKRKLEEMMAWELEKSLLLSEVFEDPVFNQLLETMGRLGENCVPVMIRALLNWRSNQHVVDGTLKNLLQKEQNTKLSQKDGLALLEERHHLATDFIFCTALLSLLKTRNESLDEAICSQLEAISFEHFKPMEKQTKALDSDFAEALLENRKEIPKLYAQILGYLSPYRLTHIAAALFKEVGVSSKKNEITKNKIAVLEGVRFLQLKTNTQNNLEQTMGFLSRYFDLFKHKSSDLKHTLAMTIVSICQPLLLEKPSKDVDYSDWYKASTARYNQFQKKIKTRTPKTWIPLLYSLLCLCDKEFFLEHVWNFLGDIFRYVKDKANRSVGLEAVQNCLATYLVKYAEVPETMNKRLSLITSHVFPSGNSWKSQHDGTQLSIYVKIITHMADKKLDYAIKTVIFDLLKVDNTLQADRVTIAIRALMKIVEDEKKKAGLPENTGIPPTIMPYMASINEFFSAIWLLLDKSYGQITKLHATKQNQELLVKERPSIKLLRAVISCIPYCLPTKIATTRFMEIMARYLIHLDEVVKLKAHDALTRIMTLCPSLRSDVIHAVARLLLTIPDSSPTLICEVLQKNLSPLLHLWSREIKPPDHIEPRGLSQASNGSLSSVIIIKPELKSEQAFNPSSIEAIGLMLLCSPFAVIRVWALEILQSVRLIAASVGEQSEDDDDLPPARVMDVIDETGHDIVQRLHSDFRFRIQNKTSRNLPMAKSLEKLWASDERENQIAWTYSLGALLPLTLHLCPEAANIAWKIVCQRMKTPLKAEDKAGHPVSREQELIWWSNYIVFACATVSDSVCEPGNKKIPGTPSELFNNILSLLKSEVHGDAVVMALERANPQVYDVLFASMQHIEQEYTMKKRRKGTDELRNQISFIYGFVSENMRHGTLVENENLRQIFLGWISETMKYLSHPSTECILDNHRALRYNFCDIVGNVAKDLHRGLPDLFEPQLRKELFHFLKNWCRGEAMLNDEMNKKTYMNNLAQIRDAENKISYEKAVKDQTFVLQQVACSAASALLLGPIFDEEVLSPKGSVFNWVNTLLEQKDRKKLYRLARTALESFLQNSHHTVLLDTAINQCYSTNPSVARGYFLALVELFRTQHVDMPMPVLFTLIILKAGDSSLAIRRSAIQLLQLISSHTGEENISYSPLAISSSLDVTFRRSQYELSQRLAKQNPKLVAGIAAEMVHRLEFEPWEQQSSQQPQQIMQKQKQQKQLLTAIIPWIQEMNNHIHTDDDYLTTSEIEEILQNFLLITLRYADIHPIHVQKIWTTLASEDESIAMVIEYLLNIGVKKRNPSFIPLAKKVISFFGRAASQVTVDTLVNELSSLDTDNKKKERKAPGSGGSLSAIPTPFDSLLPDNVNERTPARGHLALIFLAELAFEIKEEFLVHLPVVLHQVFLGFDTSVSEHCRVLLLNLIHSLVVERLESTEEAPETFPQYNEAMELEEYLQVYEKKQLWANEDISIERPRKVDLPSSKDLISLAQRVVRVFVQEESLREDWGTEALKWAISCPSAHLVARSYQVYRGLLPCSVRNITPIDMLESLAQRISSRTSENISVSFEILFTLQAMVDTLDAAKLWLFPQIFWAAVALLNSDFEQEYLQSSRLLSKLVTRFNFSDIAVQNVFLSGLPTTWDPPFRGLQPLVMRGLLSPTTDTACTELIVKFILMPCPQIFYPEPKRLLSNMLSLLPWLTANITEESTHPCFTAFGYLAEACGAQSAKLQKVFTNCKKKIYTSMEQFFQDLYKPFTEIFFPKYTVYTLKFLFALLESEQKQCHKMVLRFLRYLFSVVSLSTIKKPKFITRWLTIVSRFVSSADPLWRDALEVLEQVVKQSELSVTHIYSLSLRPVPFSNPPKEFPGQVFVSEDGDVRAIGALRELLKSTEQREKNNGISREFFEHFFYTEEETVEEEVANDKNRSPKQTFVSGNEDSASDDDEDVDFSEFQDILAFAPGGLSPSRPSISDFSSNNEIEYHRSQDLLESIASGDSGTVRMTSSRDDGNDVLSPSAWTRRRWRKLSERRRFSNEAEMFEIFPVAGQLLNLLLDEYRSSLVAYSNLVPTTDERKALQAPVLKAEIFDQPIFQQQIPEPKQNSVLFSILSSKYRSLADQDGLFLRTFTDKRIQLVDAFNRQLRIYLEHKDNVESLKAKVPKDFDDSNRDHRSAVLLFAESAIKLHYHMLLLCQINASLQALVNGVLDPSAGQPLGESDSDEEKQRALIEKELERNRILLEPITRKLDYLGSKED